MLRVGPVSFFFGFPYYFGFSFSRKVFLFKFPQQVLLEPDRPRNDFKFKFPQKVLLEPDPQMLFRVFWPQDESRWLNQPGTG